MRANPDTRGWRESIGPCDRRPDRTRVRVLTALGPRGRQAGQDLGVPAGQRRARHPHEPGLERPVGRRQRRLAGRRTDPAHRTRGPSGRDLPRLPGPGLAHRRHDRRRDWPRAAAGGTGTGGGGADHRRALVNPVGPAPEAESVLLVNASPDAVDLSGWRIADTAKKTCGVTGGPLAPGATLQVPLTDGVALGPRRLRSHLGLSRAHQERAAGTQLDPTGHSSLEPFRPFPSRDGEGWRRRRNAEVRSGAMPYVRRLSRPVMSNEGLVPVGATDGRA